MDTAIYNDSQTPSRTVIIIQARMNSSRLPGKILMDIAGETMLARVVRRATRATGIDHTVVATTSNPSDDATTAECARLGVSCFRGSEEDVLDRYYQAARATHAELVVRVTADCPLIDPELLDQVINELKQSHADYASNTLIRAWPQGLDVEVFTRAALEYAWREAQHPWQRSHVTPYIYQHSEIFRLHALTSAEDYSALRWTVDTAADLAAIRAIYREFQEFDDWYAALAVIKRNPAISEINRAIKQKSLEEG